MSAWNNPSAFFPEAKECIGGESLCPSPALCRSASFEQAFRDSWICVFLLRSVGFPFTLSDNSKNTLVGHRDSF